MGAKHLIPPRTTKLSIAELVSDIISTLTIEGQRGKWKDLGYHDVPLRIALDESAPLDDVCEACGHVLLGEEAEAACLPRNRLFKITDSQVEAHRGADTLCFFVEPTTLADLAAHHGRDGETVGSFLSCLVDGTVQAGGIGPKNHFGLARKVAFLVEDEEVHDTNKLQELRAPKEPVVWEDCDDEGDLNSIFLYLHPADGVEKKAKKVKK